MDKIPSATSRIRVATSVAMAGREAAGHAAYVIRDALTTHGAARVIFASAPSQEAMLTALAEEPGIDWGLVRSFHMDEYLNLPVDHPNNFGRWLEERLPVAAHAGLERIRTHGKPATEAVRYGALISESPIDLVCLGVGVNGHIAFNEPGTSDLDDPEIARVVTLNDASRRQQVDEKLFATLDEVPTQALTLTVPALLSARSLVCSVVGSHKADAVAQALHGPVGSSIPASFLRTHPDVTWFLDEAAATGPNREPGRSDTSLQL